MSDADVPRALRIAAAWSWRLLVVAAVIALAVAVLVKLRLVVLPVVAAIALSTLLVPPARWLSSRRVPATVAALVVVVGGVAALAAVLVLVTPSLAGELDELGSGVREGAARVVDWVVKGPFGVTEGDVDRYVERAAEQLRANARLIAGGVLASAIALIEVIAGILLALVLLFFFVRDGRRMWLSFLRVLPPGRRALADEVGDRAWRTVGAYLRGVAIVAAVDTVLIGLALWIIGVPLVLPLMALVFLGAFFPLVGAFVSGAVAALVALVTVGPLPALLVVGAIVVVQQLEGDVVYPVVVGRAIELHPVAILLALTAGTVLGGIIGALVSVPLAAVLVGSLGVIRERAET